MTYRQNIPKIIHQIWLGSKPRPTGWMDTWRNKHPDWQYKLWTDDNIPALVNQKQFHQMDNYPGKADILRYELLFRYGGVFLDADFECLQPLDARLLHYRCFLCYENERVRPGLICNGVIGCKPQHPLMQGMMNAIAGIDNINQQPPWITVGPVLMTKIVDWYRVYYGKIAILPSYTFLPEHYSGQKYQGRGKVYARHYWMSTPEDMKS